jgi:hypothetical protein
MKKNLIVLIIIAILATIMYLISGYSQTKLGACTLEAKVCPDGSLVGRAGPNCQFVPCPTAVPGGKTFCGGIAGVKCSKGYRCQMDGQYPDAGGTCVRDSKTKPNPDYKCPERNYVNCMPGPNNPELKWECTPEFIQWAEENCPAFKGATY